VPLVDDDHEELFPKLDPFLALTSETCSVKEPKTNAEVTIAQISNRQCFMIYPQNIRNHLFGLWATMPAKKINTSSIYDQ
jgi:hypothetical protein